MRADCDTYLVSLLKEKRLAPLPFSVVCSVAVALAVDVLAVEGVITFEFLCCCCCCWFWLFVTAATADVSMYLIDLLLLLLIYYKKN